jgi:prophage regulatory protein
MPQATPSLRLLTALQVSRLCLVSSQTIRRMVRAGTFPKPVKISPQRIAWREEEVQAWLVRRK